MSTMEARDTTTSTRRSRSRSRARGVNGGGGNRAQSVSTRVAQKLSSTNHDSKAIISIPHRPRLGGTYSRKTAAVSIETVNNGHHRLQHHHLQQQHEMTSADALSLSGTTPPTSPTRSGFPAADAMSGGAATPKFKAGLSLDLPDSHDNFDKSVRNQGAQQPDAARDMAFRKHQRGIGSIDSILSSTTCVNTQSEYSRPDSRLSQYSPKKEYDDDIMKEVSRPRAQSASPCTVRGGPDDSACEDPDYDDSNDAEAGLLDQISIWVLRNALGKDVDDCPAPLLIWDCTHRYLQELWGAVNGGNAGFIHATSHQAGMFSPGAGSESPDNGDHGSNSGQQRQGKGKRKAEGSDGDGDDPGGQDDGDKEGDMSTGNQSYNSRSSNISNFSCPYRKRNPLRFNVRQYYVCATHSFADMSQLKKHIRAHHPPVQKSAGSFLCPRCCQGFPVKDDLDRHLRQTVVCRLADDQSGMDPEDGITQKIISSLEARSVRAKIDNWNSLWKLLFPGDHEIPDPAFVPVMEVFDFVAESKRFLTTLKDLLELQYRHVLEGSSQPLDLDRKLRQGLERSTQSIYTWIETVVQDWEQRIAGAVSFFTSSAFQGPGTTGTAGATDGWAGSAQLLPPSPALTPTVPATGIGSSASNMAGGDSPDMAMPVPSRETHLKRPGYSTQYKRIRRSSSLARVQPASQIPTPTQRSNTPQSYGRAASVGAAARRARPVLPSQSTTLPIASAPSHQVPPAYNQAALESLAATNYAMPYSSPTASPGIFHHSADSMVQYHGTTQQGQAQSYQPSEQTHVPVAEQMDVRHHEYGGNDLRHSTASRIGRLMSGTPRSSLGSTGWMREDSNRDSSQTLVEAHPPGRCQNMYCPSCNKTLPDDMMTVTHAAAVAMHHHHHPQHNTKSPTPPGGGLTAAAVAAFHESGVVHVSAAGEHEGIHHISVSAAPFVDHIQVHQMGGWAHEFGATGADGGNLSAGGVNHHHPGNHHNTHMFGTGLQQDETF